MRLLKAVVPAWILCGTLGFGLTMGHFCGMFPHSKVRDQLGISTLIFIAGPFGLFDAALLTNFGQYGLRFEISNNSCGGNR